MAKYVKQNKVFVVNNLYLIFYIYFSDTTNCEVNKQNIIA